MEESPNVYLAYFSFDKRSLFETIIQIVERPPVYAFENFLCQLPIIISSH